MLITSRRLRIDLVNRKIFFKITLKVYLLITLPCQGVSSIYRNKRCAMKFTRLFKKFPQEQTRANEYLPSVFFLVLLKQFFQEVRFVLTILSSSLLRLLFSKVS